MIIMVENTTLHIYRILMTRPKLRRPRSSVQLVGFVVDSMVNAAVDAAANAKVTSRSGAKIRGMGIETIMGILFKRGAILVCDIAVVKSVDRMLPMLLYFMPIGSIILEFFLAYLP